MCYTYSGRCPQNTFMSISSCLLLFLHKVLDKNIISASHSWKQFNLMSSFFPFGFLNYMLLVKEKVELRWISYLILLFSHTVKTVRSLNPFLSVKNVLAVFRKNKQMKSNREGREGSMQIPDNTHQKYVQFTHFKSADTYRKREGVI